MSDRKHILVIGAGIVGVACALALQRRGFAVSVADDSQPGSGCSFGNAGNVSPGAVVPYSVPGSLRHLPGWLFDPLGPLSIRPAHFPRFIPWGLRWLRASTTQRALETSRAMRALHADTLTMYRALLAPLGEQGLIETSGQLWVSRTPHKAPGPEIERFMREAAGVRAEHIEGARLREIEPALAPEYCSGLYLPDNGNCVNPHRLVQVLARLLFNHGASHIGKRVKEFDRRQGMVAGVVYADDTRQEFDQIVIAAGVWSGQLSGLLDTRVPLEAERGYHITLTDPGLQTRLPVTNKDFMFATAPMEMGLRLAGTAEYAGVDARPDWRRALVLLRHARKMFPGIRTQEYSRWMGRRPALPDGLPVLGRSPHFANVMFAFGNAHFGLTAAPMMGDIIARLAAGEAPGVDLRPYDPGRFTGPARFPTFK